MFSDFSLKQSSCFFQGLVSRGSYPEIVYQIQPRQQQGDRDSRNDGNSGVQQAIIVSSEDLRVLSSPLRHLLPRGTYQISPPISPRGSLSPTPSSRKAYSTEGSSPGPTVLIRSPSQIVYTTTLKAECQRVNPKEYYDSLPYPPNAYHVPITIPSSQASQVIYHHAPTASLSSEQSHAESLQYSDTVSEQSDSSASVRVGRSRSKSGSTISARIRDDKTNESFYLSNPDSHRLLGTGPTNSLKRQLYVSSGNGYGTKLKTDDLAKKASVIRPATTKKREITSAFSPLLANQKESEV